MSCILAHTFWRGRKRAVEGGAIWGRVQFLRQERGKEEEGRERESKDGKRPRETKLERNIKEERVGRDRSASRERQRTGRYRDEEKWEGSLHRSMWGTCAWACSRAAPQAPLPASCLPHPLASSGPQPRLVHHTGGQRAERPCCLNH